LHFLPSQRCFLEMAFMCCPSGLSQAKETGTSRRLVVAAAIAFVFTVAAAPSSVQAQTLTPDGSLAPRPTPSPTPTVINSDLSAGAAVTNLGSNFLERLGNQATNGYGGALRSNPAGGGASESTDAPRFRTWAGAYGI
jgi:hypothetical protein